MLELKKTDFKRNKTLMLSKILETESSFLAGENLSILFPARWLDAAANLARVDITVSIVGVLLIKDSKNNYDITKIPTRIITNPNRMTDVSIDGELYKEMHYERGDQLICNRTILKDNSDLFPLFNEFFFKANIPFYVEPSEVVDVFINADKFAGSRVGQNALALELMTSVIAKNADNLEEPLRIALNRDKNAKAKFVNLLNPFYTFKTTFGRISGSYAKSGTMASLLNPSDNENNKIENILRA